MIVTREFRRTAEGELSPATSKVATAKSSLSCTSRARARAEISRARSSPSRDRRDSLINYPSKALAKNSVTVESLDDAR